MRVRDAGVSDVLGNIILLGITALLVAAAGAQIIQTGLSVPPEPPQVDVRISFAPGSLMVKLIHAGGPPADMGDVRVRAAINTTPVLDAVLGTPGASWAMGDSVEIGPLAVGPGAGSIVDVDLLSLKYGAPIGSASFSIPDAGSPSAAPTFEIRPGLVVVGQVSTGNSSYVVVSTPATIVMYANVSHGQGRKAVAEVAADLVSIGGSGGTRLEDQGQNGDLVAADGNYSLTVFIPVSAVGGLHVIQLTATDIEGRAITTNVTVAVTSQYYNKMLVNKTVHRLLEYSGTGSGDKLTITLKLKLIGQPMNFSDGSVYHVDSAEFRYDPPKPTDPGVLSLPKICTSADNRIVVFQAQNATIPQYERSRDDLRYYVATKWLDAANRNPFFSGVEANSQYQYFLYRSGDTSKVVKDDAWPSSFTDCNG